MVRGCFETINREITSKVGGEFLGTLIFVLGGETKFGSKNLCEGHGAFCTEEGELFTSNAELLKIDFDSQSIFSLLSRVGISRENAFFEFSDTERLRNIAKCFFETEVIYDNAMLESGIAGVVLSSVKKSEDAISAKDYIERTEAYIEENLGRPIKVEEIAQELDISRGYLRNLFYKARGMSPQEYLMNRRMLKAKKLLEENELSVSAVAGEVGYDDALGFSRMFKRYFGVSPSEYRRDNAIIANENAIKEKVMPKMEPKPVNTDTAHREEALAKVSEPEKIETIDDIAALIEKAAAAAKADLEKKDSETSPPPFWLL